MFERVKRLNYKTVKNNLVVAVFEKENHLQLLDEAFEGSISKALKKGLISSKAGTVTEIFGLGNVRAEKVYFVGMGKTNDVTRETVRKAGLAVASKLKNNDIIVVDTFKNKSLKLEELVEVFAESLVIGKYKFNQLKSKDNETKEMFLKYNAHKEYDAEFKRGQIFGESTNSARTLVNLPHNYMNAINLADYAVQLGERLDIDVQIIEKDEIEKMGMGAYLAVNQGSLIPPKLIYMKYQGKETWENPIALVGKGLTFDTGGYNLKPNSKNMKTDMGGSAAVLGAIEAIAGLKMKENVMVIIAATDNMIGKEAFLPDDVITAANGKTIEIFSTDAEGRLTLADALWFAQKEGAHKIIDVATLTGACVVALGTGFTGAFTNTKQFLKRLDKVAKQNGEPIWHMPITKHFHDAIKGKVADINNGGVRAGGASAAAAFLENFIEEKTKWIHLDIAGTAAKAEKGATGVMVRSLAGLVEKESQN